MQHLFVADTPIYLSKAGLVVLWLGLGDKSEWRVNQTEMSDAAQQAASEFIYRLWFPYRRGQQPKMLK